MFRTHTIQAATSNYLSPYPNSPPDTNENVLMSSASVTSLQNLSKIMELSSETQKMMKQLKTLRNKYDKRIKIQREMIEEECKKRSMRKRIEESKGKYCGMQESKEEYDEEEEEKYMKKKEDVKEEVEESDEEYDKKDLKKLMADNSLLFQKIMLLSGQLAPIMDRIGRLYTDFSPHLLYSVN